MKSESAEITDGEQVQTTSTCHSPDAGLHRKQTKVKVGFVSPKWEKTLWITTNCGKFLKRWEYQTIWPASWEICMQVKRQQLELDMEQQTGSK